MKYQGQLEENFFINLSDFVYLYLTSFVASSLAV
jgi:hypothetical protein